MTRTPQQLATREAAILASLPATQTELHERTGIPQSSLSRWLEQLQFEKKIHWKRVKRTANGGRAQKTYEAGPMPDGERRRRQYYLSPAERMRETRERMERNGEYEDFLARRRAIRGAKRTVEAAKQKTHVDPLMNAFFGATK